MKAITGTVDYTTQSFIASSPASVLICGWIRNPDFANSTWPYSRGNLDFVNIYGGTTTNDNWNIQAIVCNSSAASASDTDAAFNYNTMLYASGAQWVGDYSYYSQGGHTTTQIMSWIFCAVQVTLSGTDVVVKQWVRFGLAGTTMAVSSSTITQATIRTATGNASWAAGVLNRLEILPSAVDNSWRGPVTRVRAYATSTEPTTAQLDAIAEMDALDTTSALAGVLWADWPYEWLTGAAVLTDRSGNGRSLTAGSGQTLVESIDGPAFVTTVTATVAASVEAPTALVSATAQQPDPVAVVAASIEAPTAAVSATVYGVTFVGVGDVAGGTGAITPALPSGLSVGDTLLLAIETASQAISIATANGGTWTEVTGSPQGTGAAGGTSATRLTLFTSTYNGTQTAPVTSDAGDHQDGCILAYRGCSTTAPINVTSSGVEATSDTSWSITGATSTVANCRVVIIGARMNDNAAAHFSAWTNSSLTDITERFDAGTTQGNGGGIGIADGLMATAGTYNATTVTNATTTVKAFMTVALAPAMPSVTTTATVAANSAAPTAAASAASGVSLSASVAASATAPTATASVASGASLSCATAAYAVAPTVSVAAQSGVALSCTASASTAAPTASVAAQSGVSLSAAVAASCAAPTASATASSGASLSATVSGVVEAPTCSAAASIGGALSATVAASVAAPTASAVCVSGAALSATVDAATVAPSVTASAMLGNGLSATVSASAAAPTVIASCLSGVALTASVSATTIAPTAETVAVSGVSVSASVSASSAAPAAAVSATIGGFISCTAAASASAPNAAASAVSGASLTCSVAASGSAPTCSTVATAEQASPVATVSASNAAPAASAVASSGLSLESLVSANTNAPTAAASAVSGFQLLVLAAASVAVATAAAIGQSGAELAASSAASIAAPVAEVTASVPTIGAVDALSAAPTASVTAYLGLSLSAECAASVSVSTCSVFAMIGEPFVPISGTRRTTLRTWKASIPVRTNTRRVTQ